MCKVCKMCKLRKVYKNAIPEQGKRKFWTPCCCYLNASQTQSDRYLDIVNFYTSYSAPNTDKQLFFISNLVFK